MRYAVDSDVLANIQRASHAQSLQQLGKLPVIITEVVWEELTVGPENRRVPPKVAQEAEAMLKAIAEAPTMLEPPNPEAETFLRLQADPPTEGRGEHSVIAYTYHHDDVTAVLHDRRALHRGIEELRGRALSMHGFLEVLRANHGLPAGIADDISTWYCSRHQPQRPPLWW